jgi:dienelactone hydrolase
MAEAASDLAPIFLKHGYAFFYLCRRGQGLSADQGPFIQYLLKQAEAKSADARKQLHYQLITGSQLDDALAGLTFLKAAPDVDPKRIAIVGHSFGGVLTLLSGDHDSTIRAEVAFAAGANSWRASQELRERTLAAVGKTAAPVMLVYAANDYDTTPRKDISAELDRLRKSHLLKIYPVIGKALDDGHSLLYLGISEWELDVFSFWTTTSNTDSNQLNCAPALKAAHTVGPCAAVCLRMTSKSETSGLKTRTGDLVSQKSPAVMFLPLMHTAPGCCCSQFAGRRSRWKRSIGTGNFS